MLEENGSTVYQRPDGSWVTKPITAERPASVHATRLEAERFARDMLKSQGGGLLVTIDWGRQIRQTVA